MTTLEILAYVLILLSIPFKGIALINLNNKNRDFAVSKKRYMQWNIISYLLLVPGIVLFVTQVILK
ncbi:MAG: hypothetical protein IKU46_00660 [Peptococcaceae bacterium]|nr:hypothetical protein [Peptococcaceae bacterium]